MNRRDFIRYTGSTAAALSLAGTEAWSAKGGNPLPRWKGFNLLDFFSPDPKASRPPTQEEYFKWMRDWGFDFVRIPMAYPYYLDIDRTRNIVPDDVFKINTQAVDKIDSLVSTAHKYGMHVSLNLHRAPGFCVNAGFHEPYNLWRDQAALDAFCFHWSMWAKRYKQVSRDKISFDLVNEPCMREDMNEQLSGRSPVPGDVYRRVAKAAAEAIRKENPRHMVIADGNDVGSKVIPEILDLDIAQSCRGYYPGNISHYKAPWAVKDPEHQPAPTWPGKDGDKYLDRAALEAYYKPWIELAAGGTGVHCGECGAWKLTPHNVLLAWFNDLADVLTSHKIGYALWEFSGTFGILDSQRQDVAYEDWYGHKLDRKYLEILMKH
jgi:endoglucanase